MTDIIIVITNRTTAEELCNTDQTLKQLGLSAYNNGINICGLRNFRTSLCIRRVTDELAKDFDILILPDVIFDERFIPIIKYFTKGLQTAYVLFHKNPSKPELPDRQTKLLNNMIESVQINKLYESHQEGSIYCDDLKAIALAIGSNDESQYIISLERLKRKFPDINKEKYLNLLHDCLTPKGAAETNTSFLTLEQKHIVDFLAKHSDNLSRDYIEKLTELRVLLLGS